MFCVWRGFCKNQRFIVLWKASQHDERKYDFFVSKNYYLQHNRTTLLMSNEFCKSQREIWILFSKRICFSFNQLGLEHVHRVTQNENNKYCILLPFVIENKNHINGKCCNQIVKLLSIRADKDDHKIKLNALQLNPVGNDSPASADKKRLIYLLSCMHRKS